MSTAKSRCCLAFVIPVVALSSLGFSLAASGQKPPSADEAERRKAMGGYLRTR